MIYYVLQEKKKKNVWTNLLIQVKHSKQSKLPKLQLRKNLISKFNFFQKKIIRYLLAGTLHAPLCTFYCFLQIYLTLRDHMWGSTNWLDRFSFLTFIGYKQTKNPTEKRSDGQGNYIYMFFLQVNKDDRTEKLDMSIMSQLLLQALEKQRNIIQENKLKSP